MQRLNILIAPDQRLKQRSDPVEKVDQRVRDLMDNMLETMRLANGIGLAAPQVGVLKRVIVIDLSGPDDPARPQFIANPEILWYSETWASGEEGCLSLPEHYAEVTRPAAIRVRYLDYENEVREIEADGLLAKCIQHEADHLDGVLFVDHLSSLRRNMILRKLGKNQRQKLAV
jgi:peptide deformylase